MLKRRCARDCASIVNFWIESTEVFMSTALWLWWALVVLPDCHGHPQPNRLYTQGIYWCKGFNHNEVIENKMNK